MPWEHALALIPTYVLVAFRLGAMMMFAPLFGSARVPARIKVMFAVIAAMGMTPGVPPAILPESEWILAVAIGAEIAVGLAMGMTLSLIFIAAQWAGEMIGQQIGISMGETIDPAIGGQSTVIGDVYFIFTTVVFLAIGGHRAMLIGVHDSFRTVPLLAAAVTPDLLALMVSMLKAALILAIQLAAPTLLTMLTVDLALGFVSKTMPQINVMSTGMSMKGLLGIVILILGIVMTGEVLQEALKTAFDSMRFVYAAGSR